MPLFEAIMIFPEGEVINRQIYAQSTAHARTQLENSFRYEEQNTVRPQIPCVFPATRY